MSYTVHIRLAGPAEAARLSEVALQLGYFRVINGVPVANISAMIRAIANGEVKVSREEEPK